MAANMYRVGDHVYFESSSSQPYQIRRIEELNKNQQGNVEAKVMCYFRRRDLPASLIQLADKHQTSIEEDQQEQGFMFDDLTDEERHLQKHRELFLSRQVETVPATHIRGKCSVTLLNETENPRSYLAREDSFYYSLVYDPQQKTLLADKGEIRVGSGYQVAPTAWLKEGESDERDCANLEELVFNPDSNITDRQIDQYLILARSVGTFGRALDCNSTVRQPSLHMSAAAASRDITLFHAMDMLHEHGYDLSKAMCSLVATGGPVICRDAMEEWSASEANLFEEALEKYGKDFGDIRNDFLPWKTLKSVIEYYYMWKTTDRYVQQKRVKAAENESKLRIVYIPAYNKPNPNLLSGKLTDSQMGGRPCEGCGLDQCDSWYNWGSLQMQSRLCDTCWGYWKNFGGLKNCDAKTESERPPPSQRLERVAQYKQLVADPAAVSCRCTVPGCNKEFRHKYTRDKHLAIAHGLTVRPTSPKPIMKTRAAFCLVTTPLTRLSRILCKDLLKPRHSARNPIQPINATLIKQECHQRISRIVKGELKVGPRLEERVLKLTSGSDRPSDRHSDAMSAASPASSLGRKRGFDDYEDGMSNDGIEVKRATPTSGVIRYGNDLETKPTPEGGPMEVA